MSSFFFVSASGRFIYCLRALVVWVLVIGVIVEDLKGPFHLVVLALVDDAVLQLVLQRSHSNRLFGILGSTKHTIN